MCAGHALRLVGRGISDHSTGIARRLCRHGGMMGTYSRCSPQRGPRRAGSWREERTSYAAAHTRGQCAPAKHSSDTRSSPAPHPRIPLSALLTRAMLPALRHPTTSLAIRHSSCSRARPAALSMRRSIPPCHASHLLMKIAQTATDTFSRAEEKSIFVFALS